MVFEREGYVSFKTMTQVVRTDAGWMVSKYVINESGEAGNAVSMINVEDPRHAIDEAEFALPDEKFVE